MAHTPLIDEWRNRLANSLTDEEIERSQDPEELRQAFGGHLAFGTGGVRELMGLGPARINLITIGRLAQGLAQYVNKVEGSVSRPVLVAYDTRMHSTEFARHTACVLATNGIPVLMFERPEPTPVLGYGVRTLGCAAGVVITASHNPREYNGFKVYGASGVQVTDATAAAIECEIKTVDGFEDVRVASFDELESCGMITLVGTDFEQSYCACLLDESLGIDCSNLRVVYSPLEGTGRWYAEEMLASRHIQYSLVDEQLEADGLFLSCPYPNPEREDAMRLCMDKAFREGADLALANDPDADRLGVAIPRDGKMVLLTGDEVSLLLFDFLCRVSTTIEKPIAFSTIVSTPLADAIASTHGIELRRTLTGFKYIGEQIELLGTQGESGRFMFAFEESCGYLRGLHARDKDGIDALQLVCEMAAWHKARGVCVAEALSELYERYGYIASRHLSISLKNEASRRVMDDVREKPPRCIGALHVEEFIDYACGIAMPTVAPDGCRPCSQLLPPANVLELHLAGGSRILLRPSGTEPNLKAYVFSVACNKAKADSLLKSMLYSLSL